MLALGLLPACLPLAHLPVQISIIAFLVVALLFLGFCGPLAGVALMARTLHPALAVAAAIPYAVVLVWTLRETASTPSSRAPFLALIAITACALHLLSRLLPKPRHPRRFGGALLAVALISAIVAVTLYRRSNYLRWVLLSHVTTLGAPLHTLVDEPVAEFAARHKRLALESSVASPPGSGISAGAKPNVVVILLDTLRADALAAWGATPIAMPRLDRWAEQAYLFRDVLSNASWTRPSVASLFTGLYPEEHGARDRHEALADRYLTLAESFQRSGYLTAAVVTNHAAVGRAAGFAQGFDTFVEPPLTPYARAERVRAIAERLVGGRDVERPLFLYLHFLDPHDPYLAGSLPKGTRPTDYLPAYRAELAYLDNQLDGLLRFLESELGSRTWIAITSDHGEEFGDHGRAGHGHTLHRELVHLPFLLRGPGTDRGFVDDPLELRDFHSLLSRLATSEVDPRSWASVSRRSTRYSSLEFSSPEAARWRRRYSVARRLDSGTETLTWSAYGNTYELYDSEADPFEKMNLSARLPARLAALAEALAQQTPARAPSTEAEPSAEQKLRALGYL